MSSPHYGVFRTWLRANRNLCLFLAMLVIVVMLPAFEDTRSGEILFAWVNGLIIVVAVAANGRSRRLFWTALALSVPAVLCRTVWHFESWHGFLVASWACSAAVMVVTIIRLLTEMFEAGRVTREHLLACATTYLVIGLLWCYLYAITIALMPGSFSGLEAGLSEGRSLHVADVAYFSFNLVTGVALTPVLPVSKTAQMLVILHEFVSVMYMAFVISRLVAMYKPGGNDPGGTRGEA